ncbi:MAG: DUF4159 domain-containing protein [Proteobacteria bacterium]|nr:DUF4159 domain-containing protein [Pseudomonadota bacterium]
MSLFSGLSFATPWILAALVVLPAIWWLLRVTPPAPRRVVFPPLRLLLGLTAQEETPARTPWWLLLLRMLAAALIIVALSEPTLGERPKAASSGPLILFVDNGWPAAHAWKDREAALNDALSGAAQASRPVAVIATASALEPNVSLLDAGKAARALRDLEPKSWLPDRARALNSLAKAKFADTPEIVWLSDGLDYGDANRTATALAKLGHLKILADAPGKDPLGLKPEGNETDGFKITVIRSGNEGERHGRVIALGAHGEDLAGTSFRFAPGKNETTAKLGLPLEVRNETRRIAIASEDSAGALRLLGAGSQRRAVGLVSASNAENEQPLLSDVYYLERALAPYAELRKGTIESVLSQNVSVLLLADIGKIAGADYDRVARFVSDGGLLIRFAGGRMTANVDDLVPVKLRLGGRYLGSALSWAEPQHVAAFPDASPFNGLAVPREVTVTTQVLAEPSVELAEHSWARLADGTPLVTASRKGKGWIVLFHVTAGPAWSSLPLSGLYVEMMRRLLDLAGGAHPNDLATDAATAFPPLSTLDGFGRAQKPPAEVLAIRGSELAKLKPSPKHPAGLYGAEGSEIALNAVDDGTVLLPFGSLSVPVEGYSGSQAVALQPLLLTLALLILLLDAVLSLWLRGLIAMPRRAVRAGVAAFFAFVFFVPSPHVRAEENFDMSAANDTRLAYVVTGLPDVDSISKAGLTGLGLVLKTRTSYEPEAPVGVNLAKDNLAFFPLIYWPMDPREKDLAPETISKLSEYMRNGGTILFDTRDLSLGPLRGPNSPGEQTLRRLLSRLDIPPLQPVPPDHVLTKAFYLLQSFPGRWDGGKVWVEALPPRDPDAGPEPARGGDGVSPVIIGGNDWAAAWAVDSTGQPIMAAVPGGAEQREMAFRFGVNVVMYALTGNYKTDQVHVPALLERSGK